MSVLCSAAGGGTTCSTSASRHTHLVPASAISAIAFCSCSLASSALREACRSLRCFSFSTFGMPASWSSDSASMEAGVSCTARSAASSSALSGATSSSDSSTAYWLPAGEAPVAWLLPAHEELASALLPPCAASASSSLSAAAAAAALVDGPPPAPWLLSLALPFPLAFLPCGATQAEDTRTQSSVGGVLKPSVLASST